MTGRARLADDVDSQAVMGSHVGRRPVRACDAGHDPGHDPANDPGRLALLPRRSVYAQFYKPPGLGFLPVFIILLRNLQFRQ